MNALKLCMLGILLSLAGCATWDWESAAAYTASPQYQAYVSNLIQQQSLNQALAIRPMRNKWASCSTAGNLNFNDELLTLDREVADYVIVHELLHFFVPNHGKLWKSLMRAHLGDYERLASKLPALRTEGSQRIGGK
jgi:predicted metal-dependent hydrolase